MSSGGSDAFDVLIVGAGHAGAQAAISLRQFGFAGSIGLIGEEAEPPYERPPLSKAYLAGERSFDRLLLRPPEFWKDKAVRLLPSRRVTTVDPVRRTIGASDGSPKAYGDLVWAAGGRARPLSCPGAHLAGVHSVRSRADVDALTADLEGARHVAIIGGGYIGLETAAVLSQRRLSITLFEAEDRLLARVSGGPVARFFEDEHRARGIDIRLGARVECLTEDAGRVTGVRLAGGEWSPAEVVIVGIGILPEVQPLKAVGALGENGVDVDDQGRTSLDHVYAAGDCAARRSRFAGPERVRLESVQNATDQATAIARRLCGLPTEPETPPWFWSSQYDLKLQSVGLSARADDFVVRGDPSTRSFSVIYFRQGAVVALDCVNAVRDFVQGKALVAAGKPIDPARAADPAVVLKTLMTDAAPS